MIEASELLLALRKRDDLVAYLDARGISFHRMPEDYPKYGGAIHFDLGGEGWMAVYLPNGNFTLLAWA